MRRFYLSLRFCEIGLIYSVALVTLLLLGQERATAQNADMVLHNGKVLTVDDDFATAEAVAIQGERIQAVGSDAEILPLAGPGTQVVDLKGRTVIPGLIDTHSHIHSYAERVYGEGVDPATLGRYRVDWRGVTSTDDVLAQIKGLMDKYQFEPGEWIYFVNDARLSGMGEGSTVNQAKIIMDELNRWEIDKVTPNNPVIMTMGIPIANGLMVNSKAIEILWDRYGYFLEKYGRYWVDDTGQPEGHMEPPATRIIRRFMPSPSLGDVSAIYKSYLDELAASGLTTVSSKLFPYSLEAYKLLESKGELSLRLAYGMRDFYFGTITDLDHGLEGLGNLIGAGNDKIWVNAVGASGVDGAGSRACTNQKRTSAFGTIAEWWPTGQCHTDLEYMGGKGRAAPTQGNYFREWVVQSARNGVRFANTHVAGDRSVSNMLDLVEDIHEEFGPSSTQGWAFDHCTLIDPADFERAARLNITFSCAPKYIHSVAPAAAASYGDEVANNFVVPVKSMLDAGVNVVYETDRDAYIWGDLEILMTRKDRRGTVWGPQEAVDRVTALRMITRWAADYVMKGDKLGSIEEGKLADLAVLDLDYMAIPAEEISEIRPRMTVLNGKIVYLHPDFSSENNLTSSGAVVATYEELFARRPEQRRTNISE